jgi:2-haloacid dehalogenase
MNVTDNQEPLAFVFDFGGVLIDWNPRYLYQRYFPGDPEAMERFLLEVDFAGWNHHHDEGCSMAENLARQAEAYPQYRREILAYGEFWREAVKGPIQPTLALVEKLHGQGYPLFALSNWPAETFDKLRPSYPFLNWFAEIVISGEVGIAKPDARIFRYALAKFNRPAEACLFIDDAQANIATAQRLGFQTILFTDAPHLEKELRARGVRV